MISLLQHLADVPVDLSPLPHVSTDGKIPVVLGIVFPIAGGVDLLVMALAGIRMATSRGDSQAVARARGTIIYGAVGLVVILSAFTIVAFVLTKLA